MTTEPPLPDHPGAQVLSAGAHAMRNHVATIRSVVRLIDDQEVADALDEASRALQVGLERAVVLARLELDERPATAQLTCGDLVDYAARRARREGASPTVVASEVDDVVVEVPGAWAERLVADLLHHAESSPSLSVTDQVVTIDVPLHEPVAEPLDHALVQLARACGGQLDWTEGHAALRLERVATVNAE